MKRKLICRVFSALLSITDQLRGIHLSTQQGGKAKAGPVSALTMFLMLAAAVTMLGAGQEHRMYKGLDLTVDGFEIRSEWIPPSISGIKLSGKGTDQIAIVRLKIAKWVGDEVTKLSLVSFELTLLDGTRVPCAWGNWEGGYEIGPDGERKPLPTPKPGEIRLFFVFGEKCAGADRCDKLEVPFVVPKGTTRFSLISIGNVSLDMKTVDATLK
jgi:hypothetical protein